MPRQLMTEIADKMTAYGIPVDVDIYREAFEEALDKTSGGDPAKKGRVEVLYKTYLEGFDGSLRPMWTVGPVGTNVLERSQAPLDWIPSKPNVYQMPHELVRAIRGIQITLYQPELYLLAELGGCYRWVEHYQNQGSLWDKVKEDMGLSGPIGAPQKSRFLSFVTSGQGSLADPFPWLQEAIESYSNRPPELLWSIAGGPFPLYVNRANLWQTVRWKKKFHLRNSILNAYLECGEAPILISYDGVIVSHTAAPVYEKYMATGGLFAHMRQGTFNKPERAKSRFELIDDD